MDSEKRGLIGLIVVLLAATGGAVLVKAVSGSGEAAGITFVALFALGLFKGDEFMGS